MKKIFYVAMLSVILCSYILNTHKIIFVNINQKQINNKTRLNENKSKSIKSNIKANHYINDEQSLINAFYKNKLNKYAIQNTPINLYVNNYENNDIYINYYKSNSNQEQSQKIQKNHSGYVNGNIALHNNNGVLLSKFNSIYLTIGQNKYNAYVNTNHSSSLLTEKDIILAYNLALKQSVNNKANFHIDIKSNNDIDLMVEYKNFKNVIIDQKIASYVNGAFNNNNSYLIGGLVGFGAMFGMAVFACIGFPIVGAIAKDIYKYWTTGADSIFGEFIYYAGYSPYRNIFTNNIFERFRPIILDDGNRISAQDYEEYWRNGPIDFIDADNSAINNRIVDLSDDSSDSDYSEINDGEDNGYYGINIGDPLNNPQNDGVVVEMNNGERNNVREILSWYQEAVDRRWNNGEYDEER